MNAILSSIWQGLAPVLSNQPLGDGYHLIRLHAPEVAAAALAGQFVNVRVTGGWEPLLRRPMSVGRVDRVAGTLDIWYKVVGAGTTCMAKLRPSDTLDVLGPLGKPFTLDPDLQRLAVLGRGVGIAPLVFLAEEARRQGVEVWAFLSGRTLAACFGAEELRTAGVHVTLGTDDGCGMTSDEVLSAFAETCKRLQIQRAATCGSRRMARLTARLAQDHGLKGEVSLEAQMGCGMGACKACVCSVYDPAADTGRRYALACQEGPVFPVGEVVGFEA